MRCFEVQLKGWDIFNQDTEGLLKWVLCSSEELLTGWLRVYDFELECPPIIMSERSAGYDFEDGVDLKLRGMDDFEFAEGENIYLWKKQIAEGRA